MRRYIGYQTIPLVIIGVSVLGILFLPETLVTLRYLCILTAITGVMILLVPVRY